MPDTNPATTRDPSEDGPQAGIVVQYDDANRIIMLTLPGGSTVTIGDEGRSLVLQDATGNRVGLDPSGIRLESPKDIVFSAKGSIRMEAMGGIALDSSGGDIHVKGLGVNISADMQLVAKGSMTAELSGGAEVMIKAAMVMIN